MGGRRYEYKTCLDCQAIITTPGASRCKVCASKHSAREKHLGNLKAREENRKRRAAQREAERQAAANPRARGGDLGRSLSRAEIEALCASGEITPLAEIRDEPLLGIGLG